MKTTSTFLFLALALIAIFSASTALFYLYSPAAHNQENCTEWIREGYVFGMNGNPTEEFKDCVQYDQDCLRPMSENDPKSCTKTTSTVYFDQDFKNEVEFVNQATTLAQ